MSQIIINTGNTANDGTGDPLRTAFNDVNTNFTQVFNAGPVGSNIAIANNTIQVTNNNGNLRLATNGIGVIVPATNIVPDITNARYIGTATNRFNTIFAQYLDANIATLNGNLYVAGNLNVVGNTITNDYSTANIANLTLRLAGGSSSAFLANGAGILVNSANANFVYNYSAGSWDSTIAITATSFIGDGSQLSNINANVDANDLLGNTLRSTILNSSLTSFGLIDNISVAGDIVGNVIFSQEVQANELFATYLTGDGSNIANITASAVVGAVSLANVATTAYTANLAALATQAINADTALFAINANLAAFANVATSAQTANTSYYSVQADNANSAVVAGMTYELSPGANLSITGNITTGNYFIGNGSQLTGIVAVADYSNANVAAYLPIYTGNLDSVNTITTSGNIDVGGIINLPQGHGYQYTAVFIGYGSNTAQVTFQLVCDLSGTQTEWVAGIDVPGTGYSIGQSFTYDSEFLDIPGASVTISIIDVDGDGGVTELGFTPPPLYPTSISRQDGFIALEVDNLRWTFGINGNLTLPNNTSSINYANGQPYNGSLPLANGTSNFNIAVADGNPTITSNGNTWTFGNVDVPDGLYWPDGSFQTTAFVGSATYAEALVNESNATVTTGPISGTQYVWTFDDTGNLTLPGNLITTGPQGNITGADVISGVTLSASGNLHGRYSNGNSSINIADDGNITFGIGPFNTTRLDINSLGISVQGNIGSSGKILNLADAGGDGIAINGAGIVAGANIATLLYDNGVFGWTVNQGFHPTANATYNLGRAGRYWNNLYAININAIDQAIDNSITVSNSISAAGTIYGNLLAGNGYNITNVNAVQVVNGTSNVTIPTTDGNVVTTVGGTNQWIYGTDGSTTLGNGAKLSGSPSDFALDPATINAIDLRGGDGTGFYTDSGQYTVRANGSYSWTFDSLGNLLIPFGNTSIKGTGANSNANFGWVTDVIGPEASMFTANVSGAYINVNLANNVSQWSFGNDGILTLPTGGHLGTAGKGWTGLDGGNGNPVSVTSLYSSGMYSACLTAGIDGSLSISTYGDGTGLAGNWIFDINGVLTVSGDINGSGASPAPSINGFDSINAITLSASGNVIGDMFILSDAGNLTSGVLRQNQNPPFGTETFGIEMFTSVADNPNVFSSVSAGPDYVALLSTNAGNANVIAQGGYGVTISTSNSTGGAIKTWTFQEGGNTVFPGAISAVGNVAGSYILGDGGLLSNINLGNTTSTTGNISAGNFIGNLSNGGSKISIVSSGNISLGVGPFGTTVVSVGPAGTSTVGNVSVSGYISAAGNITSNANVITVAASGGNGIAVSGAGFVAGTNVATMLYDNSVFGWTVNQGFHPTANTTFNLGRTNRYWNNLYAVNVNATNLGATGFISATGNVTGDYILGNGSQLTGIVTTASEPAFTIQSTDFSASVGNRYGVNTTGNIVTATLPASPTTGGAIFFADAGGAYATNNLIINPNGQTIMGTSGNMTVSTNNQSFGLFYNGTTWRTYSAG